MSLVTVSRVDEPDCERKIPWTPIYFTFICGASALGTLGQQSTEIFTAEIPSSKLDQLPERNSVYFWGFRGNKWKKSLAHGGIRTRDLKKQVFFEKPISRPKSSVAWGGGEEGRRGGGEEFRDWNGKEQSLTWTASTMVNFCCGDVLENTISRNLRIWSSSVSESCRSWSPVTTMAGFSSGSRRLSWMFVRTAIWVKLERLVKNFISCSPRGLGSVTVP